MVRKKGISIVGCGWLGIPLGIQLIEVGYELKGSYRNTKGREMLLRSNIDPFELNLSIESSLANTDSFFNTDYVIISLPPGRTEELLNNYPKIISLLINSLNKFNLSGVIFLSSTSVYPSKDSVVNELNTDTPDKLVGHSILEAEQKLKTKLIPPLTILRLAGLIGGDRLPQNYLKEKESISMGSGPTNLIHRNDCIRVIEKIINDEIWFETFNVCCDEHPTRKEYYQVAANKYGFQVPPFKESVPRNYKIVDNQKLKKILGRNIIQLKNPLEMFS